MTNNVTQFPKQGAPEFMIGPFEEYRVVIEGRLIPHLTAKREGENVFLMVDNRMGITVPKDRAYDICWLVANAMAVAKGYPCLSSENTDRPFAPQCAELSSTPDNGK